MKRLGSLISPWSLLLLLTVASVGAGCSSLSQTQKGAIIGTAAGAAGGAAVGKAAGGTAEGAIIGAAIGGTAGAVIGNRMDTKAEELDEELENAEVERVGEGIKVTFDSGLLFDFDAADLRPEARANLTEFSQSMQEFEETNILIVGHTDAKGARSYNEQLSNDRAESAAAHLIEQGIDPARLTTTGKGETEPVASNETEAGRQQNRRVEVAIFASEDYRQEIQQRVGSE